MKKTPLYEKHCELGGKMINFGGWTLPVQYTGIIEEHKKVRTAAGLFDVSHMGEIIVMGPDAEAFLQKMITNNIEGVKEYKIVYSPMCYPNGGVVDDLLVYKYSSEYFLVIVNAANTDKDYQWFNENIEGQVEVKNVSDSYALLALQGPEAEKILQKLTDTPLEQLKFFSFNPDIEVDGKKAIVSRTGYTGEDGFEIYIDPEYAPMIWDKLLVAGKDNGLVPVGLGARDTLRFEVALPLYGQEISQDITPLEASLERFVKLDKDDFIGKQALAKQKEEGLKRKITGFEMVDRGIPRSRYEVQVNGKNIGFVTTGSFSPSLEKNIGLALIDIEYSQTGTELDIVIRNRPLKARTVKTLYEENINKPF